MTKRKESADYKRIKSILRNKNNIKTFHKLLNEYNYDYRSFILNQVNIEFLIELINMKRIKICKYIERLYLMNKFDEDKLKIILNKKVTEEKFITGLIHYRSIKNIFYFKNLPLKIYQEFLYKDINIINYISSQTECYNEIKQMHKYLTI
jgi:hypothetical protein